MFEQIMWRIETFDEVPSTNSLAKERLSLGEARHGDVVQARHQTAGRGRQQARVWKDESGASLLMSIVLEHVPVPRVELMQYLAATVVAESLRTLLVRSNADPSLVRLKWPNDILLGGRKVCGILSEGIWQSHAMRGMVVGIGVNVRQQSFTWELKPIATSLLQHGIEVTVDSVRDVILETLRRELDRLEMLPGNVVATSILSAIRAEIAWMRDLAPFDVFVSEGAIYYSLRFEGVADDGALMLRHADGSLLILHSGSILLTPEHRAALEGTSTIRE